MEYWEKVDSSITDLSEVDEVHEGVEVCRLDVLQYENRVLPWPHRLQDGVEVVAARAQDHPVRLHRVALRRQGHVREVLVVAENSVSFQFEIRCLKRTTTWVDIFLAIQIQILIF